MLNAVCIMFGILAMKGVTVESTPESTRCQDNLVYDHDGHDPTVEWTLPFDYEDYDRHQHRIIGGSPVNIYEYPSTVFLSIKFDRMLSRGCVGSIVAKRWIVTAGHCVHGSPPPHVTIIAGMTTMHCGGKKYTAENYVIHHGYRTTSKTRAYDIACVRVMGAFDLDGFSIAIASLPNDGDEVVTGDKLVMLGWGYSEMGRSVLSKELQKVDVDVLDQYECSENLPHYIHDYMFCTSSLVHGVHIGGMPGDSGGPLFDGHTLVGIHASGYRSMNMALPDKNLRISFFKQWILETTTS